MSVERMKGVEPSCPAWEAGVLPMNYTRILICIDDTILFSLFPVFGKSYLGKHLVKSPATKSTAFAVLLTCSESSLDGCFPFLQPVHEERGEGGEDAEDDEDPADRGGEEDGDIVARKGEASPQAAFADRP